MFLPKVSPFHKENFFLEGSHALSLCTQLCVEKWWKFTDRGKQQYSEENRSHCYFVHHKPHMDITGVQPGPPL